MAIVTKKISTDGLWIKVSDLLGITMTDNTKYSVQIIGLAKISYSTSTTVTGYFIWDSVQPFTYEKLSEEDFYINANDVLLTIAE